MKGNICTRCLESVHSVENMRSANECGICEVCQGTGVFYARKDEIESAKYKKDNKDKLLRNCVEPKTGLHIFSQLTEDNKDTNPKE
jgi:hypothetical protein